MQIVTRLMDSKSEWSVTFLGSFYSSCISKLKKSNGNQNFKFSEIMSFIFTQALIEVALVFEYQKALNFCMKTTTKFSSSYLKL